MATDTTYMHQHRDSQLHALLCCAIVLRVNCKNLAHRRAANSRRSCPAKRWKYSDTYVITERSSGFSVVRSSISRRRGMPNSCTTHTSTCQHTSEHMPRHHSGTQHDHQHVSCVSATHTFCNAECELQVLRCIRLVQCIIV